MSTEGFVRKKRLSPPQMPGGEMTLQAPPLLPRDTPTNLFAKLMPMVMGLAMLGMIAMMFTSGTMNFSNPMSLMFPMMMLMSMIGMVVNSSANGKGKSTVELNEERKDYLRYLDGMREKIIQNGEKQRISLEWNNPDPKSLNNFIGTRRMWERTSQDKDFGFVRLGLGSQKLAVKLIPPETGPLEELEPVAAVALRRFVKAHSVVHNLPTAIALRTFSKISFYSEKNDSDLEIKNGLIRSIILELATFHDPSAYRIVIITDNIEKQLWSWTKWLPHLQHPKRIDGIGSARSIYNSLEEFERDWEELFKDRGNFVRNGVLEDQPHVLVICDGGYVSGQERILSRNGIEGVTLIDSGFLEQNNNILSDIKMKVTHKGLFLDNLSRLDKMADPDFLSLLDSQSIAKQMSTFRTASAAELIELAEKRGETSENDIFKMLHVGDPAKIDPNVIWKKRSAKERLRVPIGLDPGGRPVLIDIKEAAENGMGPHGLCIGATGSGKSEFLRTLVLAMLLTHSPDYLNLILVDFKGGATFLGLDSAPHVSAVITNLEDELDLVDRMQDALYGEMNRRQEILRDAGNFPNVSEYEKARANGADLDPLPALFIVVDEFSELLSQKPDFADLFVAIGRLGRSLHMHLLLASQRLEEGKLRGLDSHLSYRIGLKTFSANESRTVLGVPDAYHLPSEPGGGYLKSDASDLVRFKAAYVSGEYKPQSGSLIKEDYSNELIETPVEFFSVGDVTKKEVSIKEVENFVNIETDTESIPPEIAAITAYKGTIPSVLEVVVHRIEGHGRKAHEVWLPPLDISPAINTVLEDLDLLNSDGKYYGQLQIPLGIVDKPYEQKRDAYFVDVSGAQGHVAIIGGPQSGKSNVLRTFITSTAFSHTPEQVQFYCLDFGGGTLSALKDLPHVGSVANRLDEDRIRRTIAEISGVLREREKRFQEFGIESIRDFRKLKQDAFAGKNNDKLAAISDDLFGDIFLVIDGFGTIRSEFEILEDQINALIAQGLSYGIHVVLTASRWAEIRPAIKDQLGTRVELRLGDPAESELNRKTASLVPVGKPGRGVSPSGLHTLIALPRVDSKTSTDDLSEGVKLMVEEAIKIYQNRKAPKVRLLPEIVNRSEVLELLDMKMKPNTVLLGINESELMPAVYDFNIQSHLIIFGDNGSGKTTVLRNITDSLQESSTSEESKILLVDYRRTLLGAVQDDYLISYASTSEALTAMMNELYIYLKKRLPGNDVTQKELRERSWWQGSEIYIVVDDYDLVATGGNNPISILLDLLPQAKDIGLHLIISRRFGGASRAMYEPVLGRLKDLSVDAFIMSGNKDEGILFNNIRGYPMVNGRGNLYTRNGSELIQINYLPPIED